MTSITPVVAMIVSTFSFSIGRSTTRSIAIESAPTAAGARRTASAKLSVAPNTYQPITAPSM
jgi:hypothetical protein